MITRRRGEKPQKGNPHRLTRDQHVIPVATLTRFANSDGFVEARLRNGRIERLPTNNHLFSVDRLWDQRAEAGYMKSVESDFQELVDALEARRVGPLSPVENRIITRFWSLWRWRNHFIDFPARPKPSVGISPNKLNKDQRERLERNRVLFIGEDGTFPERMETGIRIQALIHRDEVQFGNKHWGILRASRPNLVIPDRPGALTSVPASPRLLLAVDKPSGQLNPLEVMRANAAAILFSRNYVVVPPRQD